MSAQPSYRLTRGGELTAKAVVLRGFVAVLILAGPGVVGYILLWTLTPQEADSGAATAGQRWSLRQAGPAAMWIGIAMVAVVGATSILPRSGRGLGLLTPILILAIIAVIGLASADVAQRDRWLGRRSGWPALARLAGGLIAVVVGTKARSSRSMPKVVPFGSMMPMTRNSASLILMTPSSSCPPCLWPWPSSAVVTALGVALSVKRGATIT